MSGPTLPRDAEPVLATDAQTVRGAAGDLARPSVRVRVTRLRLRARRGHLGRLAIGVVIALVVGIAVGRATAPDPGADVRSQVESSVLAISLESDGIWTAASDGRAAVSDGLVALRRDGDPSVVEDNLDAWLVAYDAAIVRVAGVDLAGPARPVQRQLITALTLSRDAVEVLGHAAEVDDEVLRTDLTTEVGRLRSRSEQLIQSARASTAELDGGRTDVSPLPRLRSFQDGRNP
ncbi:MAG: hypothetical protein JJT89_11335 [Nitriliruptoraceae bacterium]|nr:hypothetical protein [Nitriliruptoraceae bacterium]